MKRNLVFFFMEIGSWIIFSGIVLELDGWAQWSGSQMVRIFSGIFLRVPTVPTLPLWDREFFWGGGVSNLPWVHQHIIVQSWDRKNGLFSWKVCTYWTMSAQRSAVFHDTPQMGWAWWAPTYRTYHHRTTKFEKTDRESKINCETLERRSDKKSQND